MCESGVAWTGTRGEGVMTRVSRRERVSNCGRKAGAVVRGRATSRSPARPAFHEWTWMPYDRMITAHDAAPHIDDLPTRKRENFPEIQDPVFWSFYEKARKFSLVHVTGFYNVYQSLHYIAKSGISGNAVECGC